jgi:predicted glycosyltransferase
MNDYEHAGLQRRISFRVARLVMAPDAIPVEAMEKAGASGERLFRYPGLKEDYYLADFRPDPAILDELGLDRERLLVVVRPPPETSEYHAQNPIYEAVIERLRGEDAVTVVIPRTRSQRDALRRLGARPRGGEGGPPLVVPERAIDAQSLIAYADLVVSAGGTMNREAVALGTPVYTIFTGELGAVDERLIAEDRLRPLTDPAALELAKREAGTGPLHPRDPRLLSDATMGAFGN